jgi:hypothetical protein
MQAAAQQKAGPFYIYEDSAKQLTGEQAFQLFEKGNIRPLKNRNTISGLQVLFFGWPIPMSQTNLQIHWYFLSGITILTGSISFLQITMRLHSSG